jgi:enoyl-CoA hydratase/carnithine racemase
MLATILDFPFATVALLTGHTFGGASVMALAHDYRIMNADRGFICLPALDLGLHFSGIGTLARVKLGHKIARKMVLEAHRWTGKEALADGVVDGVAKPAEMLDMALDVARRWAPKAKMG